MKDTEVHDLLVDLIWSLRTQISKYAQGRAIQIWTGILNQLEDISTQYQQLKKKDADGAALWLFEVCVGFSRWFSEFDGNWMKDDFKDKTSNLVLKASTELNKLLEKDK